MSDQLADLISTLINFAFWYFIFVWTLGIIIACGFFVCLFYALRRMRKDQAQKKETAKEFIQRVRDGL